MKRVEMEKAEAGLASKAERFFVLVQVGAWPAGRLAGLLPLSGWLVCFVWSHLAGASPPPAPACLGLGCISRPCLQHSDAVTGSCTLALCGGQVCPALHPMHPILPLPAPPPAPPPARRRTTCGRSTCRPSSSCSRRSGAQAGASRCPAPQPSRLHGARPGCD